MIIYKRSSGKSAPYLFALLLAVVFAVSLLIFLFFGNSAVHRVFFFPVDGLKNNPGEIRYLPREENREKEIEDYIKEIILGPVQVEYSRLLPKEAILNTVILRENNLYIDFSEDVLFQEIDNPLTFNESIALLKECLRFNFHYLREIYITINGQVPE